jgi:uncharacterized protein involved in exopolysaccharide biosynthesis
MTQLLHRESRFSEDRFKSNGPHELGFPELWINLTFRLRQLWDKRRSLTRALCAGFALGVLVAFLLPTEYESTAQLMPPDSQSSTGLAMVAALTGGGGGLGSVAGDLLGLKSSADQFVAILHSRTAEDDLIQRFDLKTVYRKWLQDNARKKLADNTRISVDRKSGIISITVVDHDPHRAAFLAQGYVDELDHLVATLSTSAARRERLFLEERLKSVKQDLDEAAHDFSQFASKNSAIDITEQGKAMVESAAALQGQLIAAQSELKGLEQIYSPNNVRIRSVQARIAELQQQLQKLGGNVASPGNENNLYPSIRELPILGVTYSDLYRRTKIQEAVYESLTKEYELAKVQEAKEIPSVKVLDAADVPERKSFPPRTLITLSCAFFGFLSGAVWVFARARWEGLHPDDPGKVLLAEILHSVNAKMPWSPPNGSRFQAATHQVWRQIVRPPIFPDKTTK